MARNVKKTDSIAIDTNSKDLLEQVALFDVLDGWRYGVLTIGTFGFDPLKSFSQQKDHSASKSDEEEEEEERCSNNDDDEDNNIDEEVNPLLFGHTLEDNEGSTKHEIKFSPDVIMDDSGKLRKRTTLADLFYEESDMKTKPTPHDSELNPGKKACDFCTEKEPSFANKFIPQVGKGSRPIKVLNKMVKRMLKRKIHPELERKDNKGEGQCMQALI
ncbi:Tiller Angle Control 1 [Hibiscus trionum]|uniref:Protein TILLER ANGLE CONTROL 1 n=1 Tax=Hibiscus trionum TaxID=183268 RepID=A0A9W7HEA6_HIBTR|nr:Tiller Angle Control 1 [Hibiscus trionum]